MKTVNIRTVTLPHIKRFYRATVLNRFTGEEVTETFEEWVHKGKLVCSIEDVIMDWAYSYFDKLPCKITMLEEL